MRGHGSVRVGRFLGSSVALAGGAGEQEEAVPFSRLLSETYERVGLALFAPEFLAGVPQALDLIEEAAETTVDGKQLLAVMRKEINGTDGTSGKNGCKTGTEWTAVR